MKTSVELKEALTTERSVLKNYKSWTKIKLSELEILGTIRKSEQASHNNQKY